MIAALSTRSPVLGLIFLSLVVGAPKEPRAGLYDVEEKQGTDLASSGVDPNLLTASQLERVRHAHAALKSIGGNGRDNIVTPPGDDEGSKSARETSLRRREDNSFIPDASIAWLDSSFPRNLLELILSPAARPKQIHARLDHERAANLDTAAATVPRLPPINTTEPSHVRPNTVRLIRTSLSPLIEPLKQAWKISWLQHNL